MGLQIEPTDDVVASQERGESRLFQPITVGTMRLQHRIGMCPLTRFRASEDHIPLPPMKEYYTQRASVPGTLIVTEGTFISDAQAGYEDVPGIFNEAQVEAWRDITDAVHARGSFIYCQLWALGRTADPQVMARKGHKVLSASDGPTQPDRPRPTPMTLEEIRQTVADYASAARNAVAAGFDGVELHGANGYLIDQFLQDVTNRRDDGYGGSVEKRSRFAVEAVRAVADAVGPQRVGIRLSPLSTFQGMGMADAAGQFSDVLRRIDGLGIAYVHLTEPRVAGNLDTESQENLDFAYAAYRGTLLLAGGYDAAKARTLVDEDHPERDIVVMFGRYFISNPDLPFRVKEGVELTPYQRQTFYNPHSLEGYTTYSFSPEFLESIKA